jgi:PEP-CTERM motif
MLFKNVVMTATLATVLIGTSLPSYAADFKIPLPEDTLVGVSFEGGPQKANAGKFTYVDPAVVSAKPLAVDTDPTNKGFNGGKGFENNKATDYTEDKSFSYFAKGGTATSAKFKIPEKLPDGIVLQFTYEILKAGSLEVALFDVTDEKKVTKVDSVLDNFKSVVDKYDDTFKSDNFIKSLEVSKAYSIQWKYTLGDGGTAGFNNALLTVTTPVPEPSATVGLLGFGLAVYGGALQKKRSLKRAA